MFPTRVENMLDARPLAPSTDMPRYCPAPNGNATALQPRPTRQAVVARRVIVDSAAVSDAPANAFVVMLTESMQAVRAVRVVDARVLAAPVAGWIQIGVTLAGTIENVDVIIEAARYASFDIFKAAVRNTMASELRRLLGVSAVAYDEEYDQFVLSVPPSNDPLHFTAISITVSDLGLLDLLGWTKAFMPGGGLGTVVTTTTIVYPTAGQDSIRLPQFQSFYAWPRSHEPAYVHVAQLPSTQQGAAGTVMQATSRQGQLVSTVQTMGGLNTSLAYAFPQDLMFASVDPVSHHQTIEFATPLARLSRLDVALRTAGGNPYVAARLFLVLDVYCDL